MAKFVLLIGFILIALCLRDASASKSLLPKPHENSSELIQLNATSNGGTHIFVQLLLQQEQLGPNTNSFESTLKAIVQQEVNYDWNRTIQLLPLLDRLHSTYLKEAVYNALWQELRINKIRLNPFLLIDFYAQATTQTYLNESLKQDIKGAVIARSAQILEAPFYGTGNIFPIVSNLLSHIEKGGQALFAEVMAALYDAVLLLQPPTVVVQKLSELTASTKQFAQAFLLLKERTEVTNSTAASELLTKELVELQNHSDLASIPENLRRLVNASLPAAKLLLANAKKVCVRNATDEDYITECSQTFLICNDGHNPKWAAYSVERQQRGAFGEAFSFKNSFWVNRYLKVTTNITQTELLHSIVKNVYSVADQAWIRVRYVGNFVALLDDTEKRIICGGSPSFWTNGEHHVYTRPFNVDFQWDTPECLWQLEDCGFNK